MFYTHTNNHLLLESINETSDNIIYNEEMVPVIKSSTDTGCRYLIEMDILAKFMQSIMETNPIVAINKIASFHNISEQDICIIVKADEIPQYTKAIVNIKNGGLSILKKSIDESDNKFIMEAFGRNKGNSDNDSSKSGEIRTLEGKLKNLEHLLAVAEKYYAEAKKRNDPKVEFRAGEVARLKEEINEVKDKIEDAKSK